MAKNFQHLLLMMFDDLNLHRDLVGHGTILRRASWSASVTILAVPFGHQCPSAMVAPAFPAELAQSGALLGRNPKGASGAVLTATDEPGGVELALGAAVVGSATAAFLHIEGPRAHGLAAHQMLEDPACSFVDTADPLPQFGQIVGAHLHVVSVQISKYKMQKVKKSTKGPCGGAALKKPRLREC